MTREAEYTICWGGLGAAAILLVLARRKGVLVVVLNACMYVFLLLTYLMYVL